MNKNAYLKYIIYSKKIKIKNLSEQLSLDSGYLSRIFNNKKNISNGRNLDKICKALQIDKHRLLSYSDKFNSLYSDYISSTFFLNRIKRNELFQEAKSYEKELEGSPDYLKLLMIQLIQGIVTKTYDVSLISMFAHLYDSFDEYNQNIFLIFYYGYLRETENYVQGNKIYQLLSTRKILDENCLMMLNYYHFSYGIYNRNSIEHLNSYTTCKNICLQTNNANRLINLNILYSIHLRDLGYTKDGLANDLSIYDYMKTNNITYCLDIVTNNIGNSYLLIDDYENSINFYKESLTLFDDNSKHFYIALCYYRLKNIKLAKEYISSGKTAFNRHNYYYDLILWLDSMIKNKYSKKCLNILSQIRNTYFDELIEQQKSFINLELINYYYYHHQYQIALNIASELINTSVISQSKLFFE